MRDTPATSWNGFTDLGGYSKAERDKLHAESALTRQLLAQDALVSCADAVYQAERMSEAALRLLADLSGTVNIARFRVSVSISTDKSKLVEELNALWMIEREFKGVYQSDPGNYRIIITERGWRLLMRKGSFTGVVLDIDKATHAEAA